MKHGVPSARFFIRFISRFAAAAVAVLTILLVGVQFARAIGQNVAMAHELSSVRADIDALKVRRERQRRELSRLEDPQGAIPEIHDRLRLVRPNETIIFVSPAPAASP
jgi:cell division protein FtsB